MRYDGRECKSLINNVCSTIIFSFVWRDEVGGELTRFEGEEKGGELPRFEGEEKALYSQHTHTTINHGMMMMM